MAGNRAAAIAYILAGLDKIKKGNADISRYKAYFEKLSDKEFTALMEAYRTGEKYVTLTVPNFDDVQVTIENNYKVAEELGLKFNQRVWIGGEGKSPDYLSEEALVVLMTMKIPSQRISKKQGIPKTQTVVNALTGQPTGESKGASISYPEIRIAAAMGLENSVIELAKYRGGDQRGGAALNASLMRTGKASAQVLNQFASGVESTKTLKTFLTAMHLKSTL